MSNDSGSSVANCTPIQFSVFRPYELRRDGCTHCGALRQVGLYPHTFRLIIADVERNGKLVRMKFITNNFEWAAGTICNLYKSRWDIEIFFKQLKQTLKLSDFLGYSENAVRWQVWMALLTYVVLRFIAYLSSWKGTFARLFTIIRGVIWCRLDLYSLLKCCGTAHERIRVCMQPQQLYLPFFDKNIYGTAYVN